MKKLEISMTAGYAAGFLVPTSRGTTGGVCLQPVRRRHDDVMTAPRGSTAGIDAVVGVTASTPLTGLRPLAPPIT